MRNKILFFLLFTILFSANIYSQNNKISGSVHDEDGIPLIGASIMVKGTAKGVVTNGGFYFFIFQDFEPSNPHFLSFQPT